jgi:putative heme-binding domain-containing protein
MASMLPLRFSLLLLFACPAAMAAEPFKPSVPDRQPEPPFPPVPPEAGVKMLVPGFTVRELPVRLTSLNNMEYAADGRLYAGGYDGRFHLLRDLDGDGLEERVDTFEGMAGPDYPLGMAVRDGMPWAVLTDEVVRWTDENGDGIPDRRVSVAKGFDDPELVKAPYLQHRRVDSSMALAIGPDQSVYVTMGNGAPSNAYWTDDRGVAHYRPGRRRGCLLRISPDGKVEQLNSGLRYIMSLQFNRHGDLFGTEQEGATWVPNGNPFDEFLHIQPGRHYGFPPRHPQWLPDVIDEPSVYDYTPQHQSTCGFRFNGPMTGRGRFGPEFWADDAIVTGEARGRLWRTKLARTPAGYVAQTQQFASLGMLVVDCAVSPAGDLVICCHSGPPDWGNGPQGEGRIFKISLSDRVVPQPVMAWASGPGETTLAFDRPVQPADWQDAALHTSVTGGRYVSTADRHETIRPGYAVVAMQQKQRHSRPAVSGVATGEGQRNVVISSAERTDAVTYAITTKSGRDVIDFQHDLTGMEASWQGSAGAWKGWLPHPDTAVSRTFTNGSASHDALWQNLSKAGSLELRGQLDLWQMLIPATQPISRLDYVPDSETVVLSFSAAAALQIEAEGAAVARDGSTVRLTVQGPQQNRWLPIRITVPTPLDSLAVSWSTNRDPRPRALPLRRILLPFAKPAAPDVEKTEIPEIAGADRLAGRALYNGKATCALCHHLRGDGARIGPDLANLVHRDYASVLRDISDPHATINPDAIAYTITRKDGSSATGVRSGETSDELQLGLPGGTIVRIPKSEITKAEPLKTSLMPAGLDKALSPDELRNLMAWLLTE